MTYQQYRPGFSLTPVVKNLLIINGLMLLATWVLGAKGISLYDYLGLHYWTSDKFQVYQLITHVFMHGDIKHLFSNMFTLFMFGTILEGKWGSQRFFFFYIITALGAAVLYQTVVGIGFYNIQSTIEVFKNTPTIENMQKALSAVGGSYKTTYLDYLKSTYTEGTIGQQDALKILNDLGNAYQQKVNVRYAVGASGAVFGILVAFAMYHPNTEMMLIFVPVPIKAKYFVAIFAAMELYLGIQNNPGDNVAHFAHLGGALFGYILVKYWNKNNRKTLY